ncbi:MAG: TRAP transporter substrate-binding protein [Lachnospiraceae bacterium]|nr:TRAP transporter substrate-binding protein [Lachnospiraceae bacterium]
MKRKVMSVLLTGVMMLSLVACGQSAGSGNAADTSKSPDSAAPAAQEAAPAADAASGKTVIKIASGLTAQAAENVGAYEFEKMIEEKYPEFDVQVYTDAQLGDDTACAQDVSMGNLEAVILSPSVLTGMCSKLSVFDLPFLFPNYEAADAVMESDVAKDIAAELAGNGLHVLAWYENGFRQLTNSKVDVHTPADVAGLKIRTMENEIHLAAFKALGAVPTPMAFSEVFTAMESGTIDGQENPISTIYLNSFYEVNKYCSLTNHVYGPKLFLLSESLFQKLTDEQKAFFEEAAAKSAVTDKEVNRKQCDDYIQSLRDAGMTVTELTNEEHQAFVDATAPIYDEFKSQIGEDLIKKVQDVCAKY